MVVEHVDRPGDFAAALSRVTRPGSLVVFFTVNWWSVTTLAAHFSPLAMHHWLKRRLWNTESKDTFPTRYKMNQRTTLRSIMGEASFREAFFQLLPDSSLFWRVPIIRHVELAYYKVAHRTSLPHLDTCMLTVFERLRSKNPSYR
jgi:hypothetical protein